LSRGLTYRNPVAESSNPKASPMAENIKPPNEPNPYEPPKAQLDQSTTQPSSVDKSSKWLDWNLRAALVVFVIMWSASYLRSALEARLGELNPWMDLANWIYFGLTLALGCVSGVWPRALALGGGIGLLAAVYIHTLLFDERRDLPLILLPGIFLTIMYAFACAMTERFIDMIRARRWI
jgi:hypothetical protein